MNQTFSEQIDQLINFDLANRGIEHLYRVAREQIGESLCLSAAKRFADLPENSVAVLTTGQASRSWITTNVAENDGPAGTAVLARALSHGRNVIPVLVAEAELIAPLKAMFMAAGLSPVSFEEAQRIRQPGGRLSVFVCEAYPTEDEPAKELANSFLDRFEPAILFSAERSGFNEHGIYHNARGVDYSQGKARIDYLFQAAQQRGIPTVAVGDGGNEIGMGNVAGAIRKHVRYGDQCLCGCGGGIGAVTPVDVLVTAAVSNWGCYGIEGCLAALWKQPNLIHTAQFEEFLLRRGVDVGLINSPNGTVDPNVDGISIETHKAMVTLIGEWRNG